MAAVPFALAGVLVAVLAQVSAVLLAHTTTTTFTTTIITIGTISFVSCSGGRGRDRANAEDGAQGKQAVLLRPIIVPKRHCSMGCSCRSSHIRGVEAVLKVVDDVLLLAAL